MLHSRNFHKRNCADVAGREFQPDHYILYHHSTREFVGKQEIDD
jgi:hypothetical protein